MRNLIVTLPDRLKLAWRALRDWWTALVLRWIDRYLAERDQERVPVPLDFEELEVLYDEHDFQIVAEQEDWLGWQENR